MHTLQWTAFNHAELENADAKSAFLQGDGQEMQDRNESTQEHLLISRLQWRVFLVQPWNCERFVWTRERAMKLVALGSPIRDTPERTKVANRPDQMVFSTDGLGTCYALVAAYLGDFIITGVPGQDFEKLKHTFRERCHWRTWKTQRFGLCGVRVHRKAGRTFVLDQLSYLNTGMGLFAVDTDRDFDGLLTAGEVTRVRGVWCAIQWKVSQIGPQHEAALSETQSKISRPTLCLIQETNKLVSDVKRNDVALTILFPDVFCCDHDGAIRTVH